MITANAAMYLGIVTACILEQCPDALVVTKREFDGRRGFSYVLVATKIKADGSRVGEGHSFLDDECAEHRDFVNVARSTGEAIGRRLAAA